MPHIKYLEICKVPNFITVTQARYELMGNRLAGKTWRDANPWYKVSALNKFFDLFLQCQIQLSCEHCRHMFSFFLLARRLTATINPLPDTSQCVSTQGGNLAIDNWFAPVVLT
jgi:hypothetical protein